ncbi:hypothetical protein QBC35DRAFT_93475 [Podospora australis]|uniref:Uncharacterized protein n=1 Tax=Podospora australis TaxID=1536484 RepID=A0AAN6WYR8_9PEZI|nr:hypothetical protein QBC35DRAFT_93475 [Podospora australis]
MRPLLFGAYLRLWGHPIGTPVANSFFCFNALTNRRDKSKLRLALRMLLDWISSLKGPNQDRRNVDHRHWGVVFAALQGILPLESGCEDYDYHKESRIRWRVPSGERMSYNFSGYRNELESFRMLGSIVSENRDNNDGNNLDAMLAEMRYRNNGRALDYFINTVNKLVDQKRCLFTLPGGIGGSALCEMMEGDELFVVPGIRAPLILRRIIDAGHESGEELHEFVAPALVLDCMYGRDLVSGSQAELQTVYLK